MSEKGFVFPLTVIVCLLFIIAFTQGVDDYLSRAKFVEEKDQLLTIDHLRQIAVSDVISTIHSDTAVTDHDYHLVYPDGTISFRLESEDGRHYVVSLLMETKKDRKRSALFHYNKEEKSIDKWFDMN